ncbi:hypothetical protein B0I35DRAFT_476058 [Stachybotrys elegans]|uniref:Uncharacterized protein n=1 Tax=Stachybotrys elegans TaxID=80388 RepID=A0A8K0SXY2_9HYPO|nr:hypothetical protein B0I35DRAFT_476058 [Stachybotrys elegans]
MDVSTGMSGVLIGPLTTTWSAPSGCRMNLLCSTCGLFFRAGESCASIGPTGEVQDDTSCWPPAATGVQIASPRYPFIGWGFYSPGLACPTGYVSACTAIHGQRPQWPIQFTLEEGETAIGCCPSGYACTNRHGNTCVSVVSTTIEVSAGTCDLDRTTDISVHTIAPFLATTESGGSSVTRTPTLFAPMFQLNFRSQDLSTPIETGASTTATSSSIRETQTNSPPSDNEDNGGGLSVGAQAGIGVAVGLGALILIGCLWWFIRRRKRQPYMETAIAPPEENKPPAYFNYPSELPPSTGTAYEQSRNGYGSGNAASFSSGFNNETQQRGHASELPTSRPAAEMAG